MGNKKKRKNANYKNNVAVSENAADKRKNLIITIVCAVIALVFIGGIVGAMFASSQSNEPDDDPNDGITLYGIHYVEMDFGDFGNIVIKVDGDSAPITAKNFIELVEDGFYDGLTIFRAQEDFVIQGGRNTSVTLEPIVGEFSSNGHNNPISHTRGVISMARGNAPNSATSQFFITLHDDAKYSLDGGYAAFGYVVEGMDVVDAIAETLLQCDSDSYGFVSNEDAITIVSAKKINYEN